MYLFLSSRIGFEELSRVVVVVVVVDDFWARGHAKPSRMGTDAATAAVEVASDSLLLSILDFVT